MEARYFYQTAIILFEKNNAEYTPKNAEWHLGLAQLFKLEPLNYDNFRRHDQVTEEKGEVYENLMKVIGKHLFLYLAIHEFLLGVDHPLTKDNYAKLALAYRENGELATAQKIVDQLKKIT